MSVSTETLMRAGEESVKFIDNMQPNELGIYTLRKAFEMGYLHGASQTAEELKEAESDCYGDGNVYRGVRSKDSETKTLWANELKEKNT